MAEKKPEKITYTTKRAPPSSTLNSFKKEKPKSNVSIDIKQEKNMGNVGDDPLVPDNYPEVPKLDPFDVNAESNKLPESFFIICEGSRRVGKSIFLKWLLYFYRDLFDLVIVMSETPHNGFWQPIVSNQYVHNGWNPSLVEKLLNDQVQEKEKSDKSEGRYKMRRVLIILDDIVGDRRHIHEDTMLNRLSVQGRHFGISICLTTQEPHAIGTALRNNCDMAVIFQQKSERAKKSVCNDFLNFKLDFEWQARDLLKTYTNNHDAVLVKMYILDNEIHHTYQYVPEKMTFDSVKEKVLVPDYQLGSKEQRALAKSKQGSKPLYDLNQNIIID
jgi:hypothetical protein